MKTAKEEIRTRFAPSPTGFMHVGNLRTALYAFLIAKHSNGKFVLRIEDTDKNRKIKGAIELIYETLKETKLVYDEGPDIGGKFAPYIQSERLEKYKICADKLIKNNKAYYCFCNEQENKQNKHEKFFAKDKCRNLTKNEVDKLLIKKVPFAIRQKMPLSGTTNFSDCVFGSISVENKELEDQVLIKRDGYPTYNFANVVDDHDMNITHVIRGSEYLSSMPKYVLLYEAFGWIAPLYVHVGLIMGQNENGSVSKFSKRHGAISFKELKHIGYLPEAIINYIALLGWSPDCTREIFSLDELIKLFSTERINKSPSIFAYEKLNWINSEHLKLKSDKNFIKICFPFLKDFFRESHIFKDKKLTEKAKILSAVLKPRITILKSIPDMLSFLKRLPEYEISLFENKKSKSDIKSSKKMLKVGIEELEKIKNWDLETLKSILLKTAKKLKVKNGKFLWPIRIAVSGTNITPGGAPEILVLLGKNESFKRLKIGLEKLLNNNIKN
ncbi:MAG: glutamate--tRNA ligase [Oscillospiraceae bacterium]|nr:glutamate--tRNA ligase [Oscillospiraceae bacterium]